MPTKRTRLSRRRREDPRADPVLWRHLTDRPDEGDFIFDLTAIEPAWREHGAAILADWIAEHPGTRPSCWWEYDAPEPRRRLGGTGMTCTERWPAYAPWLVLGVETQWASVDPADPPTFEAEAAYLKRLGLLAPGEARRLPRGALDPEPLPAECWPNPKGTP